MEEKEKTIPKQKSEQLAELYIPDNGKAETLGGEILRCAFNTMGAYQYDYYWITDEPKTDSHKEARGYVAFIKESFPTEHPINILLNDFDPSTWIDTLDKNDSFAEYNKKVTLLNALVDTVTEELIAQPSLLTTPLTSEETKQGE